MISTLQLFVASAVISGGSATLALSPALQTNLILVATLLFLIFATCAMLMTARSAHDRVMSAALEQTPRPVEAAARPARRRPSSQTLAVFIGLLSSLALLAVCAF
jgi:hypothetical protein